MLVESQVCDGGFVAQDGGTGGEVCVERRQALGGLCSVFSLGTNQHRSLQVQERIAVHLSLGGKQL
jgi:hypothetical protein